MSYKYYGRLIGRIPTSDEALTLNSPADTTTPFNPQEPGTKFMAYGEDATSLAFNRALGALATNIDSLAGILGNPALRSEMLSPMDPNGKGFSSLLVNDGWKDTVDLAADQQPPVWIYCGFSTESLAQNVKLFHVEKPKSGHPYSRANVLYRDFGYTNFNMTPTGVKENDLAGDFYEVADWPEDFGGTGNPRDGMPSFIPYIRRIKSDIAPYSGVELPVTINMWASDGMNVRTHTMDELCLRPGCFVEVFNNGDPDGEQGNNGLFRVEKIAPDLDGGGTSEGSKVVLTRGNLHRITVDDGTFAQGELVSWADRPRGYDEASLNPDVKTNYAHIAYIVLRPDISLTAKDLYITAFSGPNSFSGSGGHSKYSGTSTEFITGYGNVGLPDQEEGANQNWTIPLDTRIWNHWHTNDHLAPESESGKVLAVVPASYPVVFTTINTPGKFYPCTPQGFLLNPILEFDRNLLPGNNFLLAKTLTTVGEQLRSKSETWKWDAAEDASSEPYQTRQDVIATEALLGHIHHGVGVEPGSDLTNVAKSPTLNILGPSLWKIRVDDGGGADFEALLTTHNGEVGQAHIRFSGSADLSCMVRVVSVFHDPVTTHNHLVLADAVAFRGAGADPLIDPISIGNIVNIAGTVFSVVAVDEAPYLTDENLPADAGLYSVKGDVNDNRFIPSVGLNAAFHAQNSASGAVRSAFTGFGNQIFVPGGTRDPDGIFDGTHLHRPFTTILEGLQPYEVSHLSYSDQNNVGIFELYKRAATSTPVARIRHQLSWAGDWLSEGHMSFLDTNSWENPDQGERDLYADIPLTDSGDMWTGLNDVGYMHNHREIPVELRNRIDGLDHAAAGPTSIMKAFERLLLGNAGSRTSGKILNDEFDGKYEFSEYTSGVFWGANVAASPHHPDAVDLTDGYFYCAGAKKHCKGKEILNLSALPDYGPDCHVMLYWVNGREDFTGGEILATVINDPDSEHGTGPVSEWGAGVGQANVPVAVVKFTGGNIAAVIDIRHRITRTDQRDEIYVGSTHHRPSADIATEDQNTGTESWGSYMQGGMNFPSIGAACAALKYWDRTYGGGRKWTIKVVGPTYEKSNLPLGLSLPIQIPTDSLTIEGIGGKSDTSSMATDGTDAPVITCYGYHSLFDLMGHSDLTFRNLSIVFDEGTEDPWHDDIARWGDPGNLAVCVFKNSQSEHYKIDSSAVDYGRYNGGFYGDIESNALQSNILIDRVKASGPHHMFFWAGKRDAAAGNAPTGDDVPFDNLTISNCTNQDSIFGFVNIGPSNSLLTRQSDLTQVGLNGMDPADLYPFYWRNINILNCRSVGVDPWELDAGVTLADYEPGLLMDGIYLAACKEVTVRDCYITKHMKGITLGVGCWTHYCTGVIENNDIVNVYSDGITAYSDSDTGGIRITGNKIYGWGYHGWSYTDEFGVFHTLDARDLMFGGIRYLRQHRFSAIRMAGNDFVVESNSLHNTREEIDLLWNLPQSQGIQISKDLRGIGLPTQFEGWWGNRIVNNTLYSETLGSVFLFSECRYHHGMVVQGNTHRMSNSIQHTGINYHDDQLTHPIYHEVLAEPSFFTSETATKDAVALDLLACVDSIFSDNVFEGHVCLGSALNVQINGNAFNFNSTIITINEGFNTNFQNNTINNGTLIYTGSGINISSNDFSHLGSNFRYRDIYGEPITEGFGETVVVHPGVLLNLVESFDLLEVHAKIDNNTFRASPQEIYDSAGAQADVQYHQAYSMIWVKSAPSKTKITISGNTMNEDGFIRVAGDCRSVISNNSIDAIAQGAGSVLIAGERSANDWDDEATGVEWSNTSIHGNFLGGDLHVDAPNIAFHSWDELVDAFLTGQRPDDGSGEWPRNGADWKWHPAPITGNTAWYHNKLGNVSVINNTILGNANLVGVQDSIFSGNRMPGHLNTDHPALNSDDPDHVDYESMNHLTESVDLFNGGQVQLLSCKRVVISDCNLASTFMFRSSLIRVANTIYGCREKKYDLYGSHIVKSVGTYAPTQLGRAYTSFCNHVSYDSCFFKDATRDNPPDIAHPDDHALSLTYEDLQFHDEAYLNDPKGAIYSSLRVSPIAQERVADEEIGTSHCPSTRWSRLEKYVWGLVGHASHAVSVSQSHLGRAFFSACDDLKISGNRFYYGGFHPKINDNLVINESSMRPNLNDNHFTACVEIGDQGTYSEHTLEGTSRQGDTFIYNMRYENPLRHAVNAQITNNRFDSACDPKFKSWERGNGRKEGERYGSGDLTIWNYGGSLISGNHLMKSPFGYMMHSAEVVTPIDQENIPWSEAQGWVDEDGVLLSADDALEWARFVMERADAANRIGGVIRLDPNNTYPLEYYTKRYVFNGAITPVDDEMAAYSHILVGTGMHGDVTEWDRNSADAPEPWKGAEGIWQGDSSTMFDETHYTHYYPWGGVWVYNWFATSHAIYGDGYVELLKQSGGTGMEDQFVKLRAAEHYPKTLGAFLIGNVVKRIDMNDTVRQSSWAWGRHCDLRVNNDGKANLPAQAFEVPLNPQHANNHVNLNMLRHKSETLGLAIYGNFGSYVAKANPYLDEQSGPERHEQRSENPSIEDYVKRGEYHVCVEHMEWFYGKISMPSPPDNKFLFSTGASGACKPWDAYEAISAYSTDDWIVEYGPIEDGPLGSGDDDDDDGGGGSGGASDWKDGEEPTIHEPGAAEAYGPDGEALEDTDGDGHWLEEGDEDGPWD